jgi:UDP-glucuronate 4-epimerase
LEEKLQLKAKVNLMEIQPGDVSKTFADNNKLFDYINFIPKTTVKQGISDFVDWYKSYYKK